MMIGMVEVIGSRRKILQTSSPVISGSMRSSTIKLGELARALPSASVPSAAVTTEKPACSKLNSTSSTASGSSSTTRILDLTPIFDTMLIVWRQRWHCDKRVTTCYEEVTVRE